MIAATVHGDLGMEESMLDLSQLKGCRRRGARLGLLLVAAVGAVGGFAIAAGAVGPASGVDWNMNGHDPANTRSQPFEKEIGTANVARLAPKWVVTTAGDVSATPTVVSGAGGAVYFPDWGGKLWKVDAQTGAVEWSRSISEYNGITGSFSRTSPVVDSGLVYIGDQNGANFMAVDARTGDLHWITRLDPNRWALVTSSPVVVGNLVLVGVSSQENVQRIDPCCTFRGFLVALDKRSGDVVWRHYTMPENGGQLGGFAGAGIVNPPAVDVPLGLVYVGTNSHNSAPDSVAQCLGGNLNGLPPNLIDHWSESCFPPGDYFSSVLALDLRTGEVRWSYRVAGTDAWQAACGDPPPTWCADPRDLTQWDVLGSGANVFSMRVDGKPRDVVGIGSRAGIYRLFDADSGTLLWARLVGPQFGIQWGTATDEERIYVSIANPQHKQYLLQPSGVSSTGGSWAALDPASGQILWQTPVPAGADGLGPPTVANGVVYVGSMSRIGDQMYALDAATGAILWSFPAGGSVNAGAAVVKGSVYWGSGYARSGSGNNKLYAFSLDGK
jgi:polyvinyl alcohol dehydrogenase (cytochrome)